jgi:putative FmdB family regulatory protein
MPFYDYQCTKCKHPQEIYHPMAGPKEPLTCEECGSHKMVKVVAVPYVKFVGDWQTNDARGIDKL